VAVLKTLSRSTPWAAWRLAVRNSVYLAALAASGPGLLSQNDSAAALEYQVKAAFLFNFAKFVEWPPEKLGDANRPLCVCVLGKDPFGPTLDQTLQNKSVDKRPVKVLRLTSAAGLKSCHIAFVASSEHERLTAIFQAGIGSGVLLVGEMPRFAERGGMIGFTKDDNKVRLEINPAAASSAGLRISSKLLNLAKIVGNDAGKSGN